MVITNKNNKIRPKYHNEATFNEYIHNNWYYVAAKGEILNLNINEWCSKNCKGGWCILAHCAHFENKDDAVMFKLWL